MKEYVIESKSEIMMNFGASGKNYTIEALVKIITCGNLARAFKIVIRYLNLWIFRYLKFFM